MFAEWITKQNIQHQFLCEKNAFYHSGSCNNNFKMYIHYFIEIDNASNFPIDFKCNPPTNGNNVIILKQTRINNGNCAL